MTAITDIAAALAPTGRLRTGMNFGNTILTQRDRGDGQPGGVASELARELARRLGVDVEFIAFDTPGGVVDAISGGQIDICFLAVEPARAERIDFTAPYVLIETTYVVREDSPARRPDDLDREGVRISVRERAAYDLFLTRTLKAATLVRTLGAYLDGFVAGETDAAAGIRQTLIACAAAHAGLRVMDEPFAIISQAMGAPKGNAGGDYLHAFVEEMKASGFVARALTQSGQEATVAPPEG